MRERQPDSERHNKVRAVLNDTAEACLTASALIARGIIGRAEFDGMNLRQAREYAAQTQYRVKQMDEAQKTSKRPASDFDKARETISHGAKDAAKAIREGKVAQRDIRGTVDLTVGKRARTSRKSPLFAQFANELAREFQEYIQNDPRSKKLMEIVGNIPNITLAEDWDALSRIKFELDNLGKRTGVWNTRLTPAKDKIKYLKAVKTEDQ